MNRFGMLGAVALALLFLPMSVSAHCDTMEGPVVIAAQQALETGDIDKVLVWVQPQDEAAIREAFEHTRQVRALSPEAQSLADRYFFETLVRLHRAGEGAPYTGLKEEMDPAEAHFVRAGDAAIASGDDSALRQHITTMAEEGLATRFAEVVERRDYKNVQQGQEYVKAYVEYQHYVEGLAAAAEGSAGAHAEHAKHDAETHQGEAPEQHLEHEAEHGWWKFW